MKRTDTDFVVGSATKRNFKGKNPLLGFSSKVFFFNKHTGKHVLKRVFFNFRKSFSILAGWVMCFGFHIHLY